MDGPFFNNFAMTSPEKIVLTIMAKKQNTAAKVVAWLQEPIN